MECWRSLEPSWSGTACAFGQQRRRNPRLMGYQIQHDLPPATVYRIQTRADPDTTRAGPSTRSDWRLHREGRRSFRAADPDRLPAVCCLSTRVQCTHARYLDGRGQVPDEG